MQGLSLIFSIDYFELFNELIKWSPSLAPYMAQGEG